MRLIRFALLALVLPLAAEAALAQAPFIRVPVADSTVAANTGGVSFGWVTGSWGAFDNSCSTTAMRARTVECRSNTDGSLQPDANCTTTKPSATDVQPVYSSCSYSWNPGSFGSWTNVSGTATHSRTVGCLRSNGDTVADASCAGAGTKPHSTETAAWSIGGWTGWSSTCSSSANRTRTVSCINQVTGATESDGACGVAVTKPATSETQGVYTSCSYSWQASGWSDPGAACGNETWSRSVWCLRSDGTTVSDASCSGAGAKPATTMTNYDVSACSYSFVTGGWNDPGAACGNETWTRYVACRRSDGQDVADGECTARGHSKPAPTTTNYDVSACTYWWSAGGWTDWNSYCSDGATRYRSVWCTRSDGATVADAECSNRGLSRPASSETTAIYSGCSYYAYYGGWSNTTSQCTYDDRNMVQSRSNSCQRSNGAWVDPATYCGIPNSQSNNAYCYTFNSQPYSGLDVEGFTQPQNYCNYYTPHTQYCNQAYVGSPYVRCRVEIVVNTRTRCVLNTYDEFWTP